MLTEAQEKDVTIMGDQDKERDCNGFVESARCQKQVNRFHSFRFRRCIHIQLI